MINHDPETNIRYGVIPVHEFKPEYFYEACTTIYACENCKYKDKRENDPDCPECDVCLAYENVVDEDEMYLQLDEHNDVWVFKSNFFTRSAECSPCAPKAGYILDQDDLGEITYCPNPDWLKNPDKLKIWKLLPVRKIHIPNANRKKMDTFYENFDLDDDNLESFWFDDGFPLVDLEKDQCQVILFSAWLYHEFNTPKISGMISADGNCFITTNCSDEQLKDINTSIGKLYQNLV